MRRLKRIHLADEAPSDIIEQADRYEARSDGRLAKRWERAVQSALRRLLQNPNTGALCAFRSPRLLGVRRVPIAGFPRHLIFYRAMDGKLLVLRVVHGARDLESLL